MKTQCQHIVYYPPQHRLFNTPPLLLLCSVHLASEDTEGSPSPYLCGVLDWGVDVFYRFGFSLTFQYVCFTHASMDHSGKTEERLVLCCQIGANTYGRGFCLIFIF